MEGRANHSSSSPTRVPSSSVIKVSKAIAGADEPKKAGAAEAPPDPNPNQLVSLALNSHDRLYSEIRGLNIEKLSWTLGQKAKIIRGQCVTPLQHRRRRRHLIL